MATSLTALVMKIGADTSEVDKAATNMQRTMREVNSVLRQAETPADKLRKQTAALEAAFNANKISADQYRKAMDHLNRSTGKAVETKRSLLKALLPVVSAFLVFRKIRQSMTELDATIKAAASVGESVANFQALTHALGEVAGMSEGQASTAIKMMQVQLSNAALNGGKGAEAIQKLGLSVRSLMAQSPAERFNALVKAIAGHKNEAEKAALAQAVFGRAAKDVMAAVNAQAGVFEDSQKAARDLGLTLSQEQAAAIEKLNDAIARLRKVFTMAFAQMAIAIEPIAMQVLKVAEGATKLWNSLSQTAKTAAVATVATIALTVALQATARAMIATLALSGPKGWLILAGSIAAAGAATWAFNKFIAQTPEEIRNAAMEAGNLESTMIRFGRQGRTVSEEYRTQKAELEKQLQILNLGEDAYLRMQQYRQGMNQTEVTTLQNLRDEIRMVEMRQKREQEIARIRKQAAEAFTAEAKSALQAARQSFAVERERVKVMRQAIAAGPDSISAGSSEAAAFVAGLSNAAIAMQAAPDATPGEREIIKEAQRQLELQRQQLAEEKRLVTEVQRLTRVTQENAIRRVR